MAPDSKQKLAVHQRIALIQRAWTAENYQALLQFFVRVLPTVTGAERCAIFVWDVKSERILSTAGTGLAEGEIVAPTGDSIVGKVITSGELCVDNALDKRPGFHREVEKKTGFISRHLLCAPIRSVAGAEILGAVELINKVGTGGFNDEDIRLLQEIAVYLGMILENVLVGRELLALSSRLQHEVDVLRRESAGGFIATSEAMRAILDQVNVVGPLPVSILISGENGTGKEELARIVHQRSKRASKAFVAINCAAIPENLVESELFGYERGAFTGATSNRPGRFEEANGGTLFLDEIGEIPLHVQPKLLRVLQESEGSRLGSNKVLRYDFRLVCATNRDLRADVASGRFREDLFYRLFSVEMKLPPLRERPGDVIALAQAFLQSTCERFGKPLVAFEPAVLAAFEGYRWPGNVRQLRREIERLVALSPAGSMLAVSLLSPEISGSAVAIGPRAISSLPLQVEVLERQLIRDALTRTKGNKLAAAALLGITRQGLHKKLHRYGMVVKGS